MIKKENDWTSGAGVLDIVSVIANINNLPSGLYTLLVSIGASENFKTFITFAGWEIG